MTRILGVTEFGRALCGALLLVASLTDAASAQASRSCAGYAATITGTESDDEIEGTSDDDVIVAGGGNDTIRGHGGDDKICGESGHDEIAGGRGRDRAYGGDGNDSLRAAAGGDYLTGEAGNDVLKSSSYTVNSDYPLDGGRGNDLFVGRGPVGFHSSPGPVRVDLDSGSATGDGVDTLIGVQTAFGSTYDDTIVGSKESDVLLGDGGNDEIQGRGGNDQLYGSLGDDKLLGNSGRDELFGYGGATAPLVSDNDVIDGGAEIDTLRSRLEEVPFFVNLTRGSSHGEGVDAIRQIENVEGSSRVRNVLIGDSGPNTFRGGFEDDHLSGRGGNDHFTDWGGDGDRHIGGPGDDVFLIDNPCEEPKYLDGGKGTDLIAFLWTCAGGVTVDLQSGTYEAWPGTGSLENIENAKGTPGSDELLGHEGSNVLIGQRGNDVLSGAEGNDVLRGDEGVDRAEGGDGHDSCFEAESRTSCESSK